MFNDLPAAPEVIDCTALLTALWIARATCEGIPSPISGVPVAIPLPGPTGIEGIAAAAIPATSPASLVGAGPDVGALGFSKRPIR
jgi:hypothetical protein